MDKPLSIGISLGDVTGIGPEVTLKALSAEASVDDTRYLLIGDSNHAQSLHRKLRFHFPLVSESSASDSDRFILAQTQSEPLSESLSRGAPEAARASFGWVREAAQHCLRGRLEALVTAPVNKEAIVRSGIKFVGQTELLSEMAGTQRTAMMLLGTDDRDRWLRVALTTTHLPLREVAGEITIQKVLTAIDLSSQACTQLGLNRARIGVCGLNPHAGEGGKIGTEELTTIGPAVERARAQGLDAAGPLSADALFYYTLKGAYDVVVAMYHDQGLAPLKMVAFENGVNWTLGLPFVRTSPDHGTAYDIAGKGVANASSMIAALRLAKQLARGRR